MQVKDIHFIFFLSENLARIPFSFVHWAAIKSAMKLNPDYKVHLWCKALPEGNFYVDDLKNDLVIHFVSPPTEVFGRPFNHVAHQTDWLRLTVLHQHGGVYLDCDTICVKPFASLPDVEFGIAEEWANGSKQGLCNAVMIARPRARFAELWMEEFRHFRSQGYMDPYWNEHAIRVPLALSEKHPDLVHVFECETFVHPDWTVDGVAQMFLQEREFPKAIVHHLWESLSWQYASKLNETNCFDTKVSYTNILKTVLHDEVLALRSKRAGAVASGLAEAPKAESPEPSAVAPVAPPQNRSSFPPPAALPTQVADKGVRFDFNLGARVVLPNRTEGNWRVRLRDLDTGNILFQSDNKGASVSSSKRYYIRFGIEVWDLDEAGTPTPVLSHDYDARDRDVLILFPVGTLGDILAWFPYAARFGQVHGCKLTCAMSGLIIPLLKDVYPDIRFVTHEELKEQKLEETAYASYCLGLFFDDAVNVWQPTDFRHVGLHRTAGYILGVDPTEEAPRLVIPDDSRPIDEPYVCIASQSSMQAKYWSNPHGWHQVVAFFKAQGYRVICIDQKSVHGTGLVWNHIPHGAEDQTGDKPLVERARWLKHAACFVGLSSGLAWLAWATGVPVVMVSGFTHPTNEFFTPYRVINWHACNSCWNDVQHRFDHKDFLWCPRHKDTPRQYECTRLITGEQVISVAKRVPGLVKVKEPEADSKPESANQST
jgi:autotransporter strand-loop-strand O-heptosyltransferase